MSLSREEIEAGLNDPGDPYGLAHKPDYILKYIAPMQCGELERAELVRRFRLEKNSSLLRGHYQAHS